MAMITFYSCSPLFPFSKSDLNLVIKAKQKFHPYSTVSRKDLTLEIKSRGAPALPGFA